MNPARALVVNAMRHRLSVACVIAAMTAATAAPWVLAQQPRIRAAEPRTLQPLASGWHFVQDDAMTDEVVLAATGDGWTAVSLPHTWNALAHSVIPRKAHRPVDVLPEARESCEPEAGKGQGHATHDAEDPTPQGDVGRGEPIELAPGLDVAAVENLREHLVAREIEAAAVPAYDEPLKRAGAHRIPPPRSPAASTPAQCRPRAARCAQSFQGGTRPL